jgi:hypothetical protein
MNPNVSKQSCSRDSIHNVPRKNVTNSLGRPLGMSRELCALGQGADVPDCHRLIQPHARTPWDLSRLDEGLRVIVSLDWMFLAR